MKFRNISGKIINVCGEQILPDEVKEIDPTKHGVNQSSYEKQELKNLQTNDYIVEVR